MERTKKILICVLIVLGAGLRADQQPGLFGRYYTGLALDTEHMARVDPVIDFNWDGNEPTPTKPFSISWSGHVQAPADGTYTFYTVTDDGVRLWLDTAGDGATMIIDEWIDQSATEHQAVVELTAGSYPVRMDYYEKSGNASTQLWWRGPGIEKQIIPAANLRTAACSSTRARHSKSTFSMPMALDSVRGTRLPGSTTTMTVSSICAMACCGVMMAAGRSPRCR